MGRHGWARGAAGGGGQWSGKGSWQPPSRSSAVQGWEHHSTPASVSASCSQLSASSPFYEDSGSPKLGADNAQWGWTPAFQGLCKGVPECEAGEEKERGLGWGPSSISPPASVPLSGCPHHRFPGSWVVRPWMLLMVMTSARKKCCILGQGLWEKQTHLQDSIRLLFSR